MASQYCGGEKEEREVTSVCGLHGFEQSLPKGTFPNASN